MLFLNSCRVSSHIVRYDTNPPAIQKLHWHSREAQIEPPLIECECEWAFRIRALKFVRIYQNGGYYGLVPLPYSFPGNIETSKATMSWKHCFLRVFPAWTWANFLWLPYTACGSSQTPQRERPSLETSKFGSYSGHWILINPELAMQFYSWEM
jgi:hypothetical protein